MTSRSKTEITDEVVLAVAARLAVGLTKRAITAELGLSRYIINKAVDHPLFPSYFRKSLETVAATLGVK